MKGQSAGAKARRDAAGIRPPVTALHDVVDAYLLYERRVRRLCMRQLGDADAADDATQETFARAAVALRSQRPETLSAYLYGIARNVCRDEIRRRTRGAKAARAEQAIVPAADPEEIVMGAAVTNQVWRALTVRDRVLLVHRFAGYSYAEIAQRLRISVKAVEAGVARARMHARRTLEEISAVVAWLARPRRRRRGPAHGLHGARRWATWKVAVALAVLPALGSAPTVWRMAGAAPARGGGTDPLAGLAAAASGAAASDPLAGVAVSDLVLAPTGGRDRTVFASGHRLDCASACAVLARSGDGGRRWAALPARGFAATAVLLAPSYPADPVMLGAGPAGLQRSDDGGRSFHIVVATVGPAAVAPQSRPGDALVAVGTRQILLYHVGSGRVTPGPVLPDGTQATAIAFTGDGTHLLVAAVELRTSPQKASVLRCGLAGACRRVLVDADATSFRLLGLPPAAGGALGVFSSGHLYLASADGATLRSVHTFAVDELAALGAAVAGSSGVRLVAALHRAVDTPPQVGESADLGHSFVLRGGATVPAGTTALVVTPAGWIIAAVSGADAVRGDGLRCSRDGGTTWRTSC